MTEDQFTRLLAEVDIAYNQSDVKQNHGGKNWHYSLSATPLKPECILLLGFNWGASKTDCHSPQPSMPVRPFMEMSNGDLGSFARIRSMLPEYFSAKELEDIGQSNFCFFRSSKEHEISERDLQLCIPPFMQLLEYTKPRLIMCFSARLRDFLLASTDTPISDRMEEVSSQSPQRSTRSIRAIKGVLSIANRQTPIVFLPHPNARVSGESRKNAWRFALK
ncbi:MAG: hypothetical protein SH809_01050 [Rhodothermales bacterium]|nr:hypothetical protein [Rhodothermales bacterium]